MIISAIAALAIAAAQPPLHHKRRTRRRTLAPIARAADLRTTLLAMRHEMLHDFLVETGNEKPAFADPHVITTRDRLAIGPAIASLDFLGAPIVRVRVRNGSARAVDALISVRLRDAGDRSATASAWIAALQAGETRTIELYCPASLVPVALDWSTSLL